MEPVENKYPKVFDEEFIKTLPAFDKFDNPAAVMVCRYPEEEMFHMRHFIEKWFQRLPEKEKADIYSRLRSLNDKNLDHQSAFWELLLHQFSIEEGWAVTKNPIVENGLTPDFYIQTKENFELYLEVYSLGRGDEEWEYNEKESQVLRTLDSIETDFSLSINFRKPFDEKVDYESIRKETESWLASLPREKGEPLLKIENYGVHMTVTALYYGEASRKGRVGGWGGPGGTINHPTAKLKDRIADKLNKYKFVKRDGKPFVLAITVDDIFDAPTAIDWTLYGFDVISFPINDPAAEAKFHKDNSGFITPNPGQFGKPENTRLSAVMFCQKKWDNDQMMYDMRLYHNPWAANPIPEEIFSKLPQFIDTREKEGFVTLRWKNEGKVIYFS